MQKIEAIIRPMRLDHVKDALEDVGVVGLTVTDVRGYGHQRGHTEKYRGNTYVVNLLPKIKIETVVPDHLADAAVAAIEEAARTGEIGDGKVFVTEVERAIRIRTGEEGEAAL
ncbi:MAG: P-II family nitrogen regulator [Armatimonadetes bacterium]|nr:P-II family nitrogen regulator [Armatimonadota bacterium]